jgi:hypothetical protein
VDSAEIEAVGVFGRVASLGGVHPVVEGGWCDRASGIDSASSVLTRRGVGGESMCGSSRFRSWPGLVCGVDL